MAYASRRQAFLVDQGYAFKVITRLEGLNQRTDLAFHTPQERRELLMEICLAKDADVEKEKIEGDAFGSRFANGGRAKKGAGARRTAGTLSELSGGQQMSYIEYNKSRNSEIKGKGVKNAFLRKLNSSTANAKKKAAGGG